MIANIREVETSCHIDAKQSNLLALMFFAANVQAIHKALDERS
tara:strand:+ start:219997 stop:220125 length:129 start_codon:yes stop_codon:yes gene_type:complete